MADENDPEPANDGTPAEGENPAQPQTDATPSAAGAAAGADSEPIPAEPPPAAPAAAETKAQPATEDLPAAAAAEDGATREPNAEPVIAGENDAAVAGDAVPPPEPAAAETDDEGATGVTPPGAVITSASSLQHGTGGTPPDDPQAFILDRARSEVHLLLDNLSANPDVNFASLAMSSPPVAAGLPPNWLKKVCEITWPPKTNSDVGERADQAELLIRVKDYLNGLAKPASGATIAFTLMVTQGDGRKGVLRRAMERKSGSPSRASLAAEAYPDLFDKALGFRRFVRWILAGAVSALAFTLLISWYLAWGNAALADYAASFAALADADGRVNVAQAALEGDPHAGPAGQAAPQVAAPPPAPPPVAAAAGNQAPVAVARQAPLYPLHPCLPDAPTRTYPSAELRDACLSRKLQWDRFLSVSEGLSKWAGTGADVARWWANMLGSGLLPVLYGFLGAIASVVRTLSRRMRLSLLSPRDLHLTLQQLAQGTLIGACISLFITVPGHDSAGASLLGPVALSSSAIAFVAGFGVDAVFQALDALIRRLFNLPPPVGDTVQTPPVAPAPIIQILTPASQASNDQSAAAASTAATTPSARSEEQSSQK